MTRTSCGPATQERPNHTTWHRGPHDPVMLTGASASSECILRLYTCRQDPILYLTNKHLRCTCIRLTRNITMLNDANAKKQAEKVSRYKGNINNKD